MTHSLRHNVPGLYIHIPFCVSKCSYCNFFSVTDMSKISPFISCIISEIGHYKDHFDFFDTIYFGGGTPSLLTPQQLDAIITEVRRHFSIAARAEITCELNPGDISADYLDSLRDMGINRINIGIQSFDQDLLTFLGRRHSVSESKAAIELSRRAGFENIGLDFIYGIPGQSLQSWERDLRQALSWEPEHLSCYELSIEPGTPLHRRYGLDASSLPGEGLLYEFFMMTSRLLEDAGYTHYEVSNFARNRHLKSRHNQKYWDHTHYLGIGPAAHSFLHHRRWWNHASLDRYITDLKKKIPPVDNTESLSLKQLRDEALYLGLRTQKGIDLKDFLLIYDYDILKEKGDIITRFADDLLIEITNGRLHLTPRGLALADRIYIEL